MRSLKAVLARNIADVRKEQDIEQREPSRLAAAGLFTN